MGDVKQDGARRRVIVIGAGMSGILAAIRLLQAGYDVTVYEKAAHLGGTWRDNTYPGLTCDIPAHVYSYSFAPNPEWSARYAPGAEIQEYLRTTAEHYGVLEHIRFYSEVQACVWDGQRWRLRLRDGTRDEAHALIAATGVLHHPNLPTFAGLEDFDGEVFHSARWKHEVPIANRRVGVIGTGSTAVQLVSALVSEVSRLSVFQRTSQWILPVTNASYSPDDRQRFREQPDTLQALRDQLMRGLETRLANPLVDANSEALQAIEQSCLDHLEREVQDPALRARLRPDYRAACKRLVASDSYYAALQQPQCELVTTAIERFEAEGIRTTDGELHPLDVVVLATGFKAHNFMQPMEIRGIHTVLSDLWQGAPYAYRTVSLPRFPNFFMVLGPHSPVGNFSLIEVAELQVNYILQLLDRTTHDQGPRAISATTVATHDFNDEVAQALKRTIWVTGCRSWFLDAQGNPTLWPWGMDRFRQSLREPDWDHYELHP